MNYLKLVTAAAGLFPKKIKVKLIDVTNGHLLHKYKIPAQQLPFAFNKPTILEIGNTNWRIFKADPVFADDFIFKKKLTLHVQEATSDNAVQNLFNTPTTYHGMPTTGSQSLYNNFTLSLSADDWRQLEFLPITQRLFIDEDIKAVEDILVSHPNALLGYGKQYKRTKTAGIALDIPWQCFCTMFNNFDLGNIYYDNKGFIQNGFSLRSDSYVYYGLLYEGNVKSLSLVQYEGIDDELMRVLETFKLVLINWCNASSLSAELGEKLQSEYVNI